MNASTSKNKLLNSRRLGKSLFVGMGGFLVVMAAFAVQANLFLPSIRPEIAIMPVILGLVVGALLGFVFFLKEKIYSQNKTLQSEVIQYKHEHLLKQTLDEFSDCIILYDQDEKVVFSNDQYHKVFTRSPSRDQIIGCTQESLLRHSVEAGFVVSSLAKSDPNTWIKLRLEERRYQKEGSQETLTDTGQTYLSRHKRTDDGCSMIVHTDITERKNNEARLAKTLDELNAVMNTIQYGILFMDSDLKALMANKAFQDIWKFPDELIQRSATLAEFLNFNRHTGMYNVAEDDFDDFVDERTAAIRKGNLGPIDMVLADGRTLQYQCIALPKGERMLTYFDITEQKTNEEKIRHLANHDELTGLPTLRLAKEKIKGAISRSLRQKSKVAIMFIDLDGFKETNDNYGHSTGDLLLKKISQKFISSVRDSDTVARIGGDEFLVIQTEINDHHASIKVAENLVQSLETSFDCNGHNVKVGASIGIALYPDHALEVQDLIQIADKAMYQVKKNGKSNFQLAAM